MAAVRKAWSRDELLAAFSLYCRLPFGRLTQGTPEVVELARVLGRTPGAVAMKLCNFASFDPAHRERDVKGLQNASKGDRAIWDEFHADWEGLVLESEEAMGRLAGRGAIAEESAGAAMVRDTEGTATVKVRLVQRFFRNAVLVSYGCRCAICRMSLLEFIQASHIVPWSESESLRADPRNGIALCVLHDRAFDRGFIALDDDYRVMVSRRVKTDVPVELHRVGLVAIEGQAIHLPERFAPGRECLRYHREKVFAV